MLRRVSYRTAATGLLFTGLWFVLGLATLASPVPGALGVAGEMIIAWLLLFFAIMAVSGGLLTMAAVNGIFPAARGTGDGQATRAEPYELRLRSAGAAPPRDAMPEDALPPAPLPWSKPPLPDRAARIAGGVRSRRPAAQDAEEPRVRQRKRAGER